jgi:predicted metal-dependent phosphoesterase TrpH
VICDFHIHTKYSSDSLLEPAKIIAMAQRLGIDCVAITDHDTIRGGVAVKAQSRGSDLQVIVGSEIGTSAGDVIGLFLQEEVRSRDFFAVVDEIRAQDGIIVLPHPYRGHQLSDEIVRSTDVIEAYNARTGAYNNAMASKLAEEHHKPGIAGSDAHFASEIGLAKTFIQTGTLEGIRRALSLPDTHIVHCGQSNEYHHHCSRLVMAARGKRFHLVPWHLARTLASYLTGR